jgi:hypothetical protein
MAFTLKRLWQRRLCAPAFCALFIVSVSSAQTPLSFLQPTNLGDCQSLAAADFNGDGNLDVACAAETVTIWLGDGKGHFSATSQQFPFRYAQIVAGDFNGDGRADLIVAVGDEYESTGQIVFFAGNGDGTFGAQVAISDFVATTLATIRPNPDGPLDLLAVASPFGGGLPYPIQIFPGNGDGTFQNPISTGIESSTNIAVADFNGDGIPDIASIGQPYYNTTAIQVVLGSADGTFGSPIDTTITTAEPFAAGDFTGDGIPDLAWTDANNIYVYQGNGDGTFSAGPVTSTPTGIVLLAADLNGDGLADLVMEGMAIAINRGGGEFGPSAWYQNPSGPAGVAGDFRNLKVPDLFVAGDYYPNRGSGNFRAPRSYPSCRSCDWVTTGDFNNDGNLDAAVAGGPEASNRLRIYTGNGGGDFTGFVETTLTLPDKQFIDALAAADFNGDGKLDLAIGAAQYNGEVAILLGNGNGTFQTPTVVYTGSDVEALAAADFNRSGNMGLAIGTTTAVVVMCGNGAGGFTTTATITGIANTNSLVVADFNRDGIPDLATASDVYLGNGDGTFRHSYKLAETWDQVYTGDFNGDGIPDLLTFDGVYYQLVYWPGLGNGTFGLPVLVPSDYLSPVAVADLNGDGISDIVLSDYGSSSYTFCFSKGNGTFTTEVLNGLPPYSPDNVAAPGNFTKSSQPDLLFVSFIGQVVVLINSTEQEHTP